MTTSQVRALLLAGIAATSVAVVSCSADPGPAPTVSDDEIAISALQNGGYQGVRRSNGDDASAKFGSCTILAEFDPITDQPLRVTGVLLSESGASYPLGDQYLPSAELLATMPVAAKAECM